MDSSYLNLIEKLDGFIRRYYKNRLLKGLIYSVTLWLSFFLLAAVMEYFMRFGTTGRTTLFYTAVLINVAVGVKFILHPLLQLYKIGKVISHEQAAQIIGRHFPEVSDKLLNILQLNAQQSQSELVLASIEQKSTDLKPVNFSSAVDFTANRKYLRFLIIPVLVICGILVSGKSEVLTDSTSRIMKYSEDFTPPPPFYFDIHNKELSIAKGNDYELSFSVIGNTLPDKVYIHFKSQRYLLTSTNGTEYVYKFRNVQSSMEFTISGSEVVSDIYELNVITVPVIASLSLQLDYPSYVGLRDERLDNVGDITVPEGTEISWLIKGEDTKVIHFGILDSLYNAKTLENDVFEFSYKAINDFNYSLSADNEFIKDYSWLNYQVKVVKDEYPKLVVDEVEDENTIGNLFFTINAEDDYGLSRLTFNYKGVEDKGYTRIAVPVTKGMVNQELYFNWNLLADSLDLGNSYEYYFELWDNDAVNGAKSVKSSKRNFELPDLESLKDAKNKEDDQLKNDLDEKIQDAKELQDEIDRFRKEIIQKKELDWQDQQRLQDILNKQKALQQDIEKMNDEQKVNNQKNNMIDPQQERLLEKQKRLEDLFEQVLNEETKEMLRQMEEMMKELNKDQLEDSLEKLQLKNEDIERELDRNLELFKQLEVEQAIDEQKEKISELKKEQEELREQTENADSKDEVKNLQEKQEELNKKFEEFQKGMEELKEKNEKLESPIPMPDTDQLQKDIKEDMKNASDEMKSGDKDKSSDNQKDASEKMDQMEQSMMQMQSQAQQATEDMEALRQLLDNLVKLSIDQEKLMTDLSDIELSDPIYKEKIREQFKLQEESIMIQDSLIALSKRVEQIEPVITRELGLVVSNLDKAIGFMTNSDRNSALPRQQYVMTSANNLALLLDEVLKQMQEQMSKSMEGQQNCQNPGSGKPSPSNSPKMSDQLKQQLDQMKKMQKNGQTPGAKPGSGKPGGMGMSKEYARMAAQQEALRQQLQEMSNSMQEGGTGSKAINKAIKDLEENEEDILNGNITNETLKRQEDIITRLLEAEKAEKERERDNKRQSNESIREYDLKSPLMEEYLRNKNKQNDLLKQKPLDLSPFYNKKVKQYFKSLPNE